MDLNIMFNDMLLSLTNPRKAAKQKAKATLNEGTIVVIMAGIAGLLISTILSFSIEALFFLPFSLSIMVILNLLIWLIVSGFIWILTKLLGGKGYFENFAGSYAYPLSIMGLVNVILISLMGLSPVFIFLGIVTSLLWIYSMYIEYVYLMEIMKLNSGKAILVVLLPLLIFCIMVALLFTLLMGIIATMGIDIMSEMAMATAA